MTTKTKSYYENQLIISNQLSNVNRVEIIYCKSGEKMILKPFTRNVPNIVELQFQDRGKTLKIFIDKE